MAVVAGEILVGGVDVEEGVTFGVELLEISAAALCKDGVAEITVVGGNGFFAVGGFVVAIVAAETAGPFLVADMIWVSAPIGLHFGEEIRFEDSVSSGDYFVDLRLLRVLGLQDGRNFLEGFIFRRVGSDNRGYHI